MKYVIGFLYLLFNFTFTSLTFSQSTTAQFFPLAVGNIWIYSGYYSTVNCLNNNFILRVTIDNSSVISGKTYYRMSVTTKFITGGACSYSHFSDMGYYRVDTISGNIYNLISNPTCAFSPGEKIMDSLKSKLRDTLVICGQTSDPKRILTDTAIAVVLGTNRSTRNFAGGNFNELNTYTRYAGGVGVLNAGQNGMSLNMYNTLRGCVINGNVIGDTNYTLVGLSEISSEVPIQFVLNQNYPNPFNPTTQISFDIPKTAFVELIVYDASGREIKKLVNQNLSAGSYKADWNASFNSSGVYFYKLSAGEYTETKKMVLAK